MKHRSCMTPGCVSPGVCGRLRLVDHDSYVLHIVMFFGGRPTVQPTHFFSSTAVLAGEKETKGVCPYNQNIGHWAVRIAAATCMPGAVLYSGLLGETEENRSLHNPLVAKCLCCSAAVYQNKHRTEISLGRKLVRVLRPACSVHLWNRIRGHHTGDGQYTSCWRTAAIR